MAFTPEPLRSFAQGAVWTFVSIQRSQEPITVTIRQTDNLQSAQPLLAGAHGTLWKVSQVHEFVFSGPRHIEAVLIVTQ